MGFRDDFLNQRPNKKIGDLKQELKMIKAKNDFDKILKDRNEKERIKKINKNIQRMVFG